MKKETEPVEYKRGYVKFLGCKIDLCKKPLIPRPETEFWVSKAISEISYNFQSFGKRKIEILDIFCGSGCIGMAILKACPELVERVTFADKYKYFDSPNFVKSDIFKGLTPQKLKHLGVQGYDYIFANPPYVATSKKHLVQKSVLDHEPHSALFAGEDGLLIIKKFLKQAKNYLNPGGKIFMEFSPEQKPAIEKILKALRHDSGRICGFEFNKDQFNRWRWVEIT